MTAHQNTDATPMATAMQGLLDRQAIVDVLIRYATGLDRRDLAMVRSCFHPDVRAEYSGIPLEPGIDALIEHVRVLWTFRSSLHLVGNPEVTIDGDEAHTRCRAVAYLVGDGNGDDAAGTVTMRAVIYEDRFVRARGRWKIVDRCHTPEWAATAPVELLPTAPDFAGSSSPPAEVRPEID